MYKHITPNTIYYHSHTFSLVIYNFSIMYTAWCLTLYDNSIYYGHSQYIIILIYCQYHSNIAIHYCHIFNNSVYTVLHLKVTKRSMICDLRTVILRWNLMSKRLLKHNFAKYLMLVTIGTQMSIIVSKFDIAFSASSRCLCVGLFCLQVDIQICVLELVIQIQLFWPWQFERCTLQVC